MFISDNDWRWAESALHCQAIYNLGTSVPKKEKKMNDVKTNLPEQDLNPVATVVTDEQAAEFLSQLGDKLAEDGTVLVQTSEDVGSETPTVH